MSRIYPRRPARHVLGSLFATLLLVGNANAQRAPATLTLEEAHALARRHNPDYLSQQNDEIEADWAVREAYGALMPSASVGTSFGYQGGGQPRVGIFTTEELGVGRTPSYLQSSYSLGLSYRLSGETLYRPRQEQAHRRATRARIEASTFSLELEVTRRYLSVLLARDAVNLARQELARANENLKLAEARVAVGAAIGLDARQAEVERGRAEVALLRAENQERTETVRLLQQLGLDLDQEIELISEFPFVEPHWTAEELIGHALASHPQLRSHVAAAEAADAGVRMARTQYLPTLELSMGWTGYTRRATDSDYLIQQYRDQIAANRQNCEFTNELVSRLNPPLPTEDCSRIVPDPAREADILRNNDAFPFSFTREPFSAQLRLSLPIFNGFGRERRLEAARVAAENARHRLRSEELRIRTEILTAHRNLETSYRAAVLERRNRDLAADQLELARERYRVGEISFVELLDAEMLKANADRAYLTALYEYHDGLAALEAAVGRKLLPSEVKG